MWDRSAQNRQHKCQVLSHHLSTKQTQSSFEMTVAGNPVRTKNLRREYNVYMNRTKGREREKQNFHALPWPTNQLDIHSDSELCPFLTWRRRESGHPLLKIRARDRLAACRERLDTPQLATWTRLSQTDQTQSFSLATSDRLQKRHPSTSVTVIINGSGGERNQIHSKWQRWRRFLKQIHRDASYSRTYTTFSQTILEYESFYSECRRCENILVERLICIVCNDGLRIYLC